MPEYLTPGVHIEETERGPRPIEGVPTSIAALLGETERGPLTPRLVTSYKDFQHWFGSAFSEQKFLPHAVNGFLENGGKRAFVCRVVGSGAAAASAGFGDFTVRAAGPGIWGTRVMVKISPGTKKDQNGNSVGFRVQLGYWSDEVPSGDPFADRSLTPANHEEDFDDLVTDGSSPDFYGRRMPFIDLDKGEDNQGSQSGSALAFLVRNTGVASNTRPADGLQVLSGGADDPAPLGADDFAGLVAGGRTVEQGLAALEQHAYRDVALVYAPIVSTEIARAIVAHCERMRFRFAVVDTPKGQSEPGELQPRDQVIASGHAAFYYPWIVTADPRTGARTITPPGGHVLGVYARSDTERGVFKAPANQTVRGALAVEYQITDEIQDDLNSKGVNAIRNFPGRGIQVWGARTLSSDPLWKYISVRRLFIFLERSIYEGTQWVIFEPNDERLWARVIDTIRLFLRAQWRQGAMFGRTEEEAFFIRCDRTTMTQDDILNGRLICEVGIAPARPAEFVIFRIFQNTAGARR